MCVIDIMSWINSRQFKIADRNGRHYVFHRNNAGNTLINIPRNITTKAQAVAWLKAHPNKVAPPRPKAPAGPSILLPKPKKGNWKPNVPAIPFSPSNLGMLSSPKLYNPVSPPLQAPTKSPGSPNKAQWQMPCDKLKASLKKFKAIGAGRQGKVYLASRSLGSRKPFVIKIAPRDLTAAARREPQPADVEFKIQKVAYQIAPEGVVRVFDLVRCLNFIKPAELNMPNIQNSARYDKSKQGVLFMEYCAGGSLRKWLKTTKQVGDEMAQNLLKQVLGTLYKLQQAKPYFRHNDLHFENIFVSSRGFLIGDFGWARLEKNGTNPAVNTANGTRLPANWGVGPKTDARFDQHMFLSELRDFIQRSSPAKYPKTIAFLDRAIPVGYRGMTNVHVHKGRLKYQDPCPNLPTLTQLMRDPFIRGSKKFSSPELTAAKARLRQVVPKRKKRVTSANLVKAKARLRKVYTNAQLINMPANQFLKLSPKTRARAKNLRADAKVKGKLKNTTARQPTKVNLVVVPNKKRVPVPRNVMKSNKFNKLITSIWKANGAVSGPNFANAWNKARVKAFNQVENRLRRGLPAFSPSPVKKAKTPSPPKKARARNNLGMKLSPKSGRVLIKAPNSGRLVYANGSTISLQYLKNLAQRYNVNIKGLRSKNAIARKLFE